MAIMMPAADQAVLSRRGEIVGGAHIGTDHMMQQWSDLQPLAACRTSQLLRTDLAHPIFHAMCGISLH